MDELFTRCAALTPEELFGNHIVPVAWDPSRNPTPFPFPKTYVWHSLKKLCEETNVQKTIICAVPFSWQLEPLVYTIARMHAVPIAVVSPKNLALIKPYAEQGGVDLIILAPENLDDVHRVLSRTVHPPKKLVVIHRDKSTIPPSAPHDVFPYSIAHELHCVPGLPLLSHYGSTSGGDLVFERNESCTWDESGCTVTLPDVCGVWPTVQISYHIQPTERGYVIV